MTNTSLVPRSVLAALRGLIPSRQVHEFYEAKKIAELQATRLLELHHITTGPVPVELIGELPKIHIELSDMPVSGASFWDSRACQWVSSTDTRARDANASRWPMSTSTSSITVAPAACTAAQPQTRPRSKQNRRQTTSPFAIRYSPLTTGEPASSVCRRPVSGLFHSPRRGAFHLSLTVLVRYRSHTST